MCAVLSDCWQVEDNNCMKCMDGFTPWSEAMT